MELLNNCRDYAHKYYADLLSAAERSLADKLFEQAEQSNSDQEQRIYYEAMQQLRARSGEMHDCFRQELQHNFQLFCTGQDFGDHDDGDINLSNLSLVNREELEDELAISVIVSKADNRNTEQLWKLNRRLAVLRGGRPVSDERNPFGPAAVCRALQIAIHHLELESKSRFIIYKHLGKIFIVSFNKALTALNDNLAQQGILANLRFSATSEPADSNPPTAIPSAASSADGQATTAVPLGDDGGSNADNVETNTSIESQGSITNQQQIFSAIRALQAQSGPRPPSQGGVNLEGLATDGAVGSSDTFMPVDYALALSVVQQSQEFLQAVANNQPLSAEQVEKRVVSQLKKQSSPDAHHKMASSDANTVDMVGVIFRYILDDDNLSDTVKSILSHLHTPYLKLSLMDASFLDNYLHDARVLLNSMAEVGGRWVMDDSDRVVLPKLKAIVETILTGFVDDASVFTQLLEDFTRFRENLEKRSKMVEKRNTESQQGMERLEISRQRALDEIDTRLQKSTIPETSQNALRKPWGDFLAFNLLRHGEDSLTWDAALKVVDGAVWSVEQGKNLDSKEDFRRRQTEFDQMVQEGLASIGYDSDASGVLLGCLKEAQELAYHGVVMAKTGVADGAATATPAAPVAAEPKPAKSAAQSAATVAIKKQMHREKPVLTAKEQQVADNLHDIAFGTWFYFQRDGNGERLKLAWYSRVTSHYMFVNRAGIKQAVETHSDLAKGIVAGTISIVKPEKRSFMERALNAVLDRLKSKTA